MENHFVNPLISDGQLSRVARYVENNRSEGEIIIGGQIEERDGYFMQPTIFQNVSPDATIAQEEILAPC